MSDIAYKIFATIIIITSTSLTFMGERRRYVNYMKDLEKKIEEAEGKDNGNV